MLTCKLLSNVSLKITKRRNNNETISFSAFAQAKSKKGAYHQRRRLLQKLETRGGGDKWS